MITDPKFVYDVLACTSSSTLWNQLFPDSVGRPTRVPYQGNLSLGWSTAGDGLLNMKAPPVVVVGVETGTDITYPKGIAPMGKKVVRALDMDISIKVAADSAKIPSPLACVTNAWTVSRWIFTALDEVIHSYRLRCTYLDQSDAAINGKTQLEWVLTVPIHILSYPDFAQENPVVITSSTFTYDGAF
jgi:hypothetical protein